MIILLADDERLVRLGLKSMIEELEPHTHKFIEARNGKDLVKVYNENKIDLAFVDINMPLMDGLSALEKCQSQSSYTKWFILTGEKEFHLAKKAITLGVSDYLLKPISIDGLKPIIYNTNQSKKKYLIKENDSFELSIISLYNDLCIKNKIYNKQYSINEEFIYIPYLFSIDGLKDIDKLDLKLDKIYETVKQFMINNLSDNLRFAIHYINTQSLLLLIRTSDKESIDFSFLLSSMQNHDYSITLTKFNEYSSEFEFYKSFDDIVKYSLIRILENFESINYITDNFCKSNDKVIIFCNYIYQLTNSYLNKEELLYYEYLDKIKSYTHSKKIYNTFSNKCLLVFLKVSINFELDSNNNFSEFLDSLYTHGSQIFKKNKSSNNTLVDEIINYIKMNYMNDIGVNTISDLYDITPNYLSKIFKEKSGVKFIDFITSVRIDESKKLLSSSNLSIKEISNKVGYNSSTHFSKQFIKCEGITPSQFIKSNYYK